MPTLSDEFNVDPPWKGEGDDWPFEPFYLEGEEEREFWDRFEVEDFDDLTSWEKEANRGP